jgi:CHAD domain-containing protein
MAAITTLPAGVRPEHRGLGFWMERVLKELDHVRSSSDADAVHDLRVAMRRCRSVAAVMEEVDRDPGWQEMRKVARKVFRGLGKIRDAQVLHEWTTKLAGENDPIRAALEASWQAEEPNLREIAARGAAKFDEKAWKRLRRHLCGRARLVPVGGLAAECLTLQSYERAKELHARALRTEDPKPWHALRIGLKKFRYTVENLLPEHSAAWSDNLKRLQDLLGDIHDLDVLADKIAGTHVMRAEDTRNKWKETIERERHQRVEIYRQCTLGRTGIWNEWRQALPHGDRLEAASLARLLATGRAADAHLGRTAHFCRLATGMFNLLGRVNAAPMFTDDKMRRVLRGSARLHGVAVKKGNRSPQKAARQFLLSLTVPPGWSQAEWELLAWAVRYHRGPEPKKESGAFAKLSDEQQRNVTGLAGVLRLARALRKIGVRRCSGCRAEKSAEAIILRIPGLADDVETASRLAAGKHLLEVFLGQPLILKAAAEPEKRISVVPRAAEPAFISAVASH